jgi:NAD+ kinase
VTSLHIGLALHPRRDTGDVADKIVRWARSHDGEVLVDTRDADRCPGAVHPVAPAELARRADAIVSLGGDGTMLGALRLVAERPVPVLGVNLGSLGFLIEIEPDELDAALDRLEAGEFTIEQHSALVVSRGEHKDIAFNDVALARVPGGGLVQAALTVAGRPSGRYRCDALVLATPNGSTAYSYAAGGPIVSPGLDAVVVTAVAPTSGISRPVVLCAQEPVRLVLDGESEPALEIDGTLARRAARDEVLDVRLRPRAGLVVRLDSERYARRNQVKLSLLDLPFLPDEMRDLIPGGRPELTPP